MRVAGTWVALIAAVAALALLVGGGQAAVGPDDGRVARRLPVLPSGAHPDRPIADIEAVLQRRPTEQRVPDENARGVESAWDVLAALAALLAVAGVGYRASSSRHGRRVTGPIQAAAG